MENIIWYAGVAVALYFLMRLLQPQHADNELDDILSKDEYKVKGRLDI